MTFELIRQVFVTNITRDGKTGLVQKTSSSACVKRDILD